VPSLGENAFAHNVPHTVRYHARTVSPKPPALPRSWVVHRFRWITLTAPRTYHHTTCRLLLYRAPIRIILIAEQTTPRCVTHAPRTLPRLHTPLRAAACALHRAVPVPEHSPLDGWLNAPHARNLAITWFFHPSNCTLLLPAYNNRTKRAEIGSFVWCSSVHCVY